jgi:hypothetical protein
MKTSITSTYRPLLRAVYAFLIAITALSVTPRNAQAQLYVTQLNGFTSTDGFVSEYSADGLLMNKQFISGLQMPIGLAVAGTTLFVANQASNTIGEYNAATGAEINAAFISTGLNKPTGLAVAGNTLFVANFVTKGSVGAYNAATGAEINAAFIPNLTKPAGLAVAGNTLFVASTGGTMGKGIVSAYSAATGAALNPSPLVTGLNGPTGVVVTGNTLFVSNEGGNTVGVYNASTGAASSVPFITGLNNPTGLVVSGKGHLSSSQIRSAVRLANTTLTRAPRLTLNSSRG